MKSFMKAARRYTLAVFVLLAICMANLATVTWETPQRAWNRMRRRALLRAFLRTERPSDPRFRMLVPAGAMARLSERFAVIHVRKSADGGGAVATGDSINMGKLHRLMLVISFGALTGNPVLTLKSGATDGVQTTSETFRYRLADADQGSALADNYGDWATSSSLTMTGTTYDNRTVIVEIDSDELTDGQPWLTLEFSNVTTLNVAVIGIGEPRFEANDVPTVI